MEKNFNPKELSDDFYYRYVIGREAPRTDEELLDFLKDEGVDEESAEKLLEEVKLEREKKEGRDLFTGVPVYATEASIRELGRGMR